jgi:hypothetical protein
MIKKDLFIPYSLALKLKDKGFDERCFGIHADDHDLIWNRLSGYEYGEATNSILEKHYKGRNLATAATPQQAIDWLDKKHGLGIEVALDGTLMWVWRVTPLHPKASYQQQKVCTYVHSTRNEAETEAIKEALNLII